LILPDTWLDSE